jgi:SOS-response transcriptional repressor LexA
MDDIANFIKAVRELLEESQEQFAERFNTTKQNVSHWETGKSAPRTAVLIKMMNMTQGQVKLPGLENVVSADSAKSRRVPLIDYVQAGCMTEVVDPYTLGDGMKDIYTNGSWSDNSFALTVRGNSMEPVFVEDDIIIVDPTLQPRPGDFVVAKNGKDEATFKKYRLKETGLDGQPIFELVPLNEDYPKLRSDIEKLAIIGVMVEHHKRYR